MNTWIAGYQSACEDATIYYDSIGSGGGRSQFIDAAVAFAGTDAPLSDAEHSEARERCGGSEPIHLPAYTVPIAVVFNLDGVEELNLSPETIAGIFNQDITDWSDPAIAADNPGADLPGLPIQPVNRSDESGTTENFTAYLEAAAPEAWPYEHGGQWPIEPVEAGQGNSGVAAAVEAGNGTVGYVEASHTHGMPAASVGVGEEFVAMDPQAAAAMLENSTPREDTHEYDYALELDYGTTEEDVYPIVLVAYEVLCLEYEDARETALLTAFLEYVISDVGQQAVSEEVGSAPLSEDFRIRLREVVAAIEVR